MTFKGKYTVNIPPDDDSNSFFIPFSVNLIELRYVLMAIIDNISVGDMRVAVVDANPSISPGLTLPVGSIALWNNAGVGMFFLKTGGGDTNWDSFPQQALNSVATTDNTLTTIATIPITTNSTTMITAKIQAYRTGGTGGGAVGDGGMWRNTLQIKNVAGTNTIVFNNNDVKNASAGYTTSFTVSGANILAQVKGPGANVNVDWASEIVVDIVT